LGSTALHGQLLSVVGCVDIKEQVLRLIFRQSSFVVRGRVVCYATIPFTFQMSRLESQLQRYKQTSELYEKNEDEMRAEKRKLMRDVSCPGCQRVAMPVLTRVATR